MSIEKIEVENLIDILNEFGLTELEYQKDENIKVTIKKSPEPLIVINKDETNLQRRDIVEKDENIKTIVSTGIGKFYYEKPLSIGDKIKVGQNIGYILVMGLKTPINATTAGEIKEVLVENEGIVDYGKILLKIK